MNNGYLTRRTQGNDIFDVFDNFFKPMFYDDMHDMRTDIREAEGGYVLEIEMPGFRKEEISVSLEDGYLTVSGERGAKEQKYLRKEIKESFRRSYYVGEVAEEDIKAKYEDGILTLTVPKKEPKKPAVHTIRVD